MGMGAEREYDRINNEGGEGYNPHRAAREQREHEEEIAWSKTREGRKETIYRLLEKLDCSIARECGTYNPERIATLQAELAQIEAAETAEFSSAWPLELTIRRRAEWNARVHQGEISNQQQLIKAEIKQGWTLSQLKKAVTLHGIK